MIERVSGAYALAHGAIEAGVSLVTGRRQRCPPTDLTRRGAGRVDQQRKSGH